MVMNAYGFILGVGNASLFDMAQKIPGPGERATEKLTWIGISNPLGVGVSLGGALLYWAYSSRQASRVPGLRNGNSCFLDPDTRNEISDYSRYSF